MVRKSVEFVDYLKVCLKVIVVDCREKLLNLVESYLD